MLDTTPQITQFLNDNFTPSNLIEATYKLTTNQLLTLLFNVFPKDSIDDYDLYTIMVNLQYEPFKSSVEVAVDNEKQTQLSVVWCLREISGMKI